MKIFITIFLVITSIVAYGSLPLNSLIQISIDINDQNGNPIEKNAEAIFLDRNGLNIYSVTLKNPGSFDNTLGWWVHSKHSKEVSADDAKRTKQAVINAQYCKEVTIPIVLEKRYEPLSLSLHGGGLAFYYFESKNKVTLNCSY